MSSFHSSLVAECTIPHDHPHHSLPSTSCHLVLVLIVLFPVSFIYRRLFSSSSFHPVHVTMPSRQKQRLCMCHSCTADGQQGRWLTDSEYTGHAVLASVMRNPGVTPTAMSSNFPSGSLSPSPAPAPAPLPHQLPISRGMKVESIRTTRALSFLGKLEAQIRLLEARIAESSDGSLALLSQIEQLHVSLNRVGRKVECVQVKKNGLISRLEALYEICTSRIANPQNVDVNPVRVDTSEIYPSYYLIHSHISSLQANSILLL